MNLEGKITGLVKKEGTFIGNIMKRKGKRISFTHFTHRVSEARQKELEDPGEQSQC